MEDSGSPNSIIGDWVEELSGVWTGSWSNCSLSSAFRRLVFSSSTCCPMLMWWEARWCPALQIRSPLRGETQSSYLSVSRSQHKGKNENQIVPIIESNNPKKRWVEASKRVQNSKASKPVKLLMPRRISNPFLGNMYAKRISGNHFTFLFPLVFNKRVFWNAN